MQNGTRTRARQSPRARRLAYKKPARRLNQQALSQRAKIGCNGFSIFTSQSECRHRCTQGLAFTSDADRHQRDELIIVVLRQSCNAWGKLCPCSPLRRLGDRNRSAFESALQQQRAVGTSRRMALDAHGNVMCKIFPSFKIAGGKTCSVLLLCSAQRRSKCQQQDNRGLVHRSPFVRL